MTTVAQSRMGRAEAEAALAELEAQITAHADGCDQCRAARYGVVSAIWRSCPVGLELFRTELALQHRLNYLQLRQRRAARTASTQQKQKEK